MMCAANVMLTSLHCTRRGCCGGGAGAEPGPGHAGHQRAAAQPRRGGRLQRLGVLGVSSTSTVQYSDAVTTLQVRALPPHLRPLHRQHQLHPRGHVQPGRPARRAAGPGDHADYIIMKIIPLSPLQVSFWLTFLQSRIPPVEPLGDCGRSHRAASVVLVGGNRYLHI